MSEASRHRTCPMPVRRVSPADEHFFFGYYDKFPTNCSDRYLLGLKVDFIGRLPTHEEPATVGYFDLAESQPRFKPLGHSSSWCWQQSNMAQWLPEDNERLVVYNDFRDGEFVAVVHDLEQGGTEVRVLPRAIYTYSQTGPVGLSVDFARVYKARAGYGYPNPAPFTDPSDLPQADGVWCVDTTSGQHRLVLPISAMAGLAPSVLEIPEAFHWVNHVQINPSGTRFACLHRFKAPSLTRNWETRLITANMDGTDARVLGTRMVSHYDWQDDETILGWALDREGEQAFFLIDDHSCDTGDFSACFEPVAVDVVTNDGHCNFSPDRRFFANDTYPNADRDRVLMLVRCQDGVRFDIGNFHAPRFMDGEWRCDLHPNWFRNGTSVCIDSVHEGFRGLYVLDVRELVD